ncbi:MAG: hypothetical protein ABI898_04910 [Sphingomonadales bacterium]
MTIASAAAAIADRQSVSLVLVEFGTELSDLAGHLLDQLNEQARDGRTAVIVSCTPATLDPVAAYIGAPYATILCDPTPADRVMAIHAAIPGVGRVAETDRDADARRLLQLADEVARIARTIVGVTADHADGGILAVRDNLTGYRAGPSRSVPVAASDIRAMIRWRRRRDGLFGGELFADPAWDMILDLAAAQIEGSDVAISSLCIAAAVPATTALRWIKTLTDAAIFVRVADPNDRRRVYIRLADRVATSVLGFLGEAKGAATVLI